MENIVRVPEVHVFAYDRYTAGQAELLNETIRFLQALVRKDWNYLETHVDPKAEYETPAGKKMRYFQDIEELRDGKHKYDFISIQAPMIFPGENEGYVSVLTLMKGRQNGKSGIHPRQLGLRFRKEGNAWIIA